MQAKALPDIDWARKSNGSEERKWSTCGKCDYETRLSVPDSGQINWSVSLYDIGRGGARRALFDIDGGEVYGLELAPGMPFTAEVQFNSRLRLRCGSKQLGVACRRTLFIVGNKFCHTRWHTVMGVQ